MIRIGLVGTQSSHAPAFTKICNCPGENGKFAYDDVRVTALCGLDDVPENTEKIAKEGNVPFIAEKIEDMFDKVDAVMFLQRRGVGRIDTVIPFIERNIPCWIDKPVCNTIDDIERLKKAVAENGTLVVGGSTLRFSPQILETREKMRNDELGEIIGGNANFFGDWNNEYDGIFFYVPHGLEIIFSVFGYNPEAVSVQYLDNTNFTITLKYSDKLATLAINGMSEHRLTVFDKEGKSESVALGGSHLYKFGIADFVESVRTGKTEYSLDMLVAHVRVLEATERAYKSGREEKVVY